MFSSMIRRSPMASAGVVPHRKSVPKSPVAAVRSAVSRWIARSRQRRALREIAEQNDIHLLKDIGVSRQEAFREAYKPFWRP